VKLSISIVCYKVLSIDCVDKQHQIIHIQIELQVLFVNILHSLYKASKGFKKYKGIAWTFSELGITTSCALG